MVLAALLGHLPFAAQAAETPLTVDDLMAIESVRDPQVSPDGQWVAYSVRRMDEDEDKRLTQIWMVSSQGGKAIPMTAGDSSASRPRWSPDNRYLSFTASRGENGKTQVYTLDRRGGEAVQVRSEERRVGKECRSRWSPYP